MLNSNVILAIQNEPNQICETNTLVLSPDEPAAFDGDSSSTSKVYATITGDLAGAVTARHRVIDSVLVFLAFETAPDFSDKYLAVPAGHTRDDCVGQEDSTRGISLVNAFV